MQPGAAIEGAVVNQAGDPAINIVVEAQRYTYDATGRRLVTVQLARTDDRGRYRVHSLPPGEYLLTAGPDPLEQAARGATPVALGHTFYPGTGRPDEARPIPLSVGQTASGLDISLTRVPVVGLTGRVRQASGQPVTDMMVRLQRVGGPVGEVRGFSVPAGDRIRFSERSGWRLLAHGLWCVRHRAPSWNSARYESLSRTRHQPNSSSRPRRARRLRDGSRSTAATPRCRRPAFVAHDTEYSFPSLPVGAAAHVPTEAASTPTAASHSAAFLGRGCSRSSTCRDMGGEEHRARRHRDDGCGDRFWRRRSSSHACASCHAPGRGVRGRVEDDDGRPSNMRAFVLFPPYERQWRPRSRTVRAVESGAGRPFHDRRCDWRKLLDRRGIVSRRRIVDGCDGVARAPERRVAGRAERRRADNGHADGEVT